MTAVFDDGFHRPAGTPSFSHTNAFFNVPLLFTTTSSEYTGLECIFWHAGFAEKSICRSVGFSPVNVTLPVMVPPFASSATIPGSFDVSACFPVSWLDRPHPLNTSRAAKPHMIKFLRIENSFGILSCRSLHIRDHAI